MVATDTLKPELLRQEDPFGFIKPEEFISLGIDSSDIPAGTFAAHKHPPLLPSRFGGNAYGFGFFEIYDRLDKREAKLLKSIMSDNLGQIKKHHKEINHIYKKIGLLIRFSALGKPYYLIPAHLVSTSITNMKIKADEISKIIEFHRKKYMKESHKIGILTHAHDPLIDDLSIRFKEHQFIIIDFLGEHASAKETLDLVILTRDIYRVIFMENFRNRSSEILSKKQLEKYALYMLGKIYKILKQDGEIFVIANRYPLKTNKTAEISFKTLHEKKNFLLFSHIFKTRKRYPIKGKSVRVNVFDLARYLRGVYVEQEVMERLLGSQDIKEMAPKEIDRLPYLNFSLDDELAYDQPNVWPKLLSVYFNEVFHKPLIPDSVKTEWKKRFSIRDYAPDYMLTYLGQKRPPVTTLEEIKSDIMESQLTGCSLSLLADYRDSCDYLIRTLNVLKNIKNNSYIGLPEVFMERLREPLVNKKRRHSSLTDVLKLMSKVNRLERIKSYLNPDKIEGSETRLLDNFEILSFFGFSYGELKEILLIVVGHTTMGRILSGKMNEKSLKHVTDLARTYDFQGALNLLRYCRLMSMGETLATKESGINQGQLAELFDLFDLTVRVVTNRDLDWDRLLDEKISSTGGIHNKIVRKLLMMMNHFELLDNWPELDQKGDMEKEALADYDDEKLDRIENAIRLIKIIEKFEGNFLKDDPLQLPIFYRKFLNMEFHGTGHIFERMDSQLVFILLWIAVNVTRGEVINFNPILANVKYPEIDDHVKRVEIEASAIKTDYLDLATLKQLSDQLYENRSAFIMNTGFRFRLSSETQAVEISYIEMDEDIKRLEMLSSQFKGRKIPEIPVDKLEEMEQLFANLEGFYQGHLKLISHGVTELKVPAKQKAWFKRAEELRHHLKSSFMDILFQPETIHDDLNLLYHHSRTFMHFILPELSVLQDLKLAGKIYLRAPIIDHILISTKKIQSLTTGDRKNFQDIHALHKLAQLEFGPMATGIVGLNDSQVESLESIVRNFSSNRPLLDAFIKSFIFQDLGLLPALREKYRDQINKADQAQAGALFLEKEMIPERYNMDRNAQHLLVSLVKHHDRIHHIVRGEFSICALREVIDLKERDLFDAFFVGSLVMYLALGEDLILEDLAARLFRVRILCHRIMDGETTLEVYLDEQYLHRGRLFFALEEFRREGLPQNMTPADYLDSWKGDASKKDDYIRAGRMIFSMERIFRLKGIRYVEFSDLANLIIEVPLRFIYQKKNYRGIGYATFEKELYEALRIHNGIQRLPENARHFILEQLIGDVVRVFGFENVSLYLNYENMIKLLLIALSGSEKFERDRGTICVNFLNMVEKIEKRYEAVNDLLNDISIENIWGSRNQLNQFFRAKTGLSLQKNDSHRVISVDFIDRINPSSKISHMETITNVDQLKNYFHHSLQSLRKSPFYTDDYEYMLEEAFYKRLEEITDLMLDQAKRQMALLNDFKDIHHLYTDLMDRSLEIGFTDDQKHRVSDIYEFRKDKLKREKLNEFNALIEKINDINELKDYWDGIKWYLLNNRAFIGKGFEHLIAKNFDDAMERLRSYRGTVLKNTFLR